MRSYRHYLPACATVFFIIFCVSQFCYQCDSPPNTTDAETYCEPDETITFGFLVRRWVVVNRQDPDFWIAGFTGILTFATIGLWIATRRLFIGADKTAVAQLRAYVHVVKKELSNVRAGEKPYVKLILRNSGKTPALNVRTWCRLYLLDLPVSPPLPFSFENVGEGSRSIVGPGNEVRIGVDDADRLSETDVFLINSALGSQKRFWINGRVLYDDVFGNPCWTTFRLHSLQGPYINDKHGMALHWSREGNRTERSRPESEEDNAQVTD